jgi:hypothetical protein
MTIDQTARVAIVAMLVGLVPAVAKPVQAEQPETVMITLHARPGAESNLARVIERHWDTVRRLNMVTDAPHVTLRGTENGDKTYFVEIMTWRDRSLPDNAPPEILALWKELNDLVEPRNGQRGLDITEVAIVAR